MTSDNDLTTVSEETEGKKDENEEDEEGGGTKALEDRIQNLKLQLESLKSEIDRCRELNKKESQELEEVILEIEKRQVNDLVSAVEDLHSPQLVHVCQTSDTARQSQLEKRLKVRREFAAYSYEQHLMEVEKLCNQELMRVQEQASQLEPLTRMASEWNLADFGERRGFIRQDIQYFEQFQLKTAVDVFSSQIPTNNFCGLLPSLGSTLQGFRSLAGAEWLNTSCEQGQTC